MKSFLEQVDETPVTYVIALAYVTLAILTDPFHPTGDVMIEYGAMTGYRVQNGEPWRLLTNAFLHWGLVHLGFNTLALVWLGPLLERSIGIVKFILLYVVSALGGSVVGCLWHSPIDALAGGSGALFGMLGAIVAINMRSGRHLLSFLEYHGPRQILVLIAFNLVLGLLIPMVSNAAHIGGLISGFVLLFCFLDRGRSKTDALSRVTQGGWIALLAALTFYCVMPVARWDHLLSRYESAGGEERRAYGHAPLISLSENVDEPYREIAVEVNLRAFRELVKNR